MHFYINMSATQHRGEAVRAIVAVVGGRLGVKASGGIHTAEAALAMVAAGATRIGASSTAAILDGLRPLAEASERG
jgi:deoxyribose-phosphate aldolase